MIDRLIAFGRRHEAPTWLLAVAIYGGWLALTASWHRIPLWLAAPAAAWLTAWHLSLQHEVMHGHPTRNRRINDLIGFPPLGLWLPYALYRRSHLRHHRDIHLTDPLEDPESTYLTAEAWQRASGARRALHAVLNTLAGRLLVGPAAAILGFWGQQAHRLRTTTRARRLWLRHGIAVALLLLWVCGFCGIDLGTYILCFVYPGTALVMIRSLAEHGAAERAEDRTAVVEHGGLLGLLFLYNNLHLLHHARPGLAWYELPRHWRRERRSLLATRNGAVYRSYGEVARQYLVRPHHPGPHPFAARDRARST